MKGLDYVGEKLRRLMDNRGVSIRRLAEMTRLAKRTIELALSDPSSRTLETMQRIAHALEVPLDLLLSPVPIPGGLLQEGPAEEMVEVKVKIPKSLVERLKEMAKELKQDPDEWVRMWLSDVGSMHRYLCPSCDRPFAAEANVKYCPYCGADCDSNSRKEL